MRKAITALFLGLFLVACTEGHVKFPVTEQGQQDLPENVKVIRLTAENIDSYTVPEHVPALRQGA